MNKPTGSEIAYKAVAEALEIEVAELNRKLSRERLKRHTERLRWLGLFQKVLTTGSLSVPLINEASAFLGELD